MFTIITGFFGNFKNIIMAAGAAILMGYVAKQKYTAYQAESKLKTIENKIAKANVKIAKETAKAKAKAIDITHNTEMQILRDLKVERKQVLAEMDAIEDLIEKTQADKKNVGNGRKSGPKITMLSDFVISTPNVIAAP